MTATSAARLATILISAVLPEAMRAQQQLDANLYAYFDWSGGPFRQNLDQQLMVKQKAKASYWAMIWNLSTSKGGGYMGLQTDGNRFDGSQGDTAIFSLWGAQKSEGPGCGKFGGEGTGLSCRLAYPINTDRWYRLRVWKISADSTGVWWGAWVLDETTGKDSYIGKIQVPAAQATMSDHANFSEYYGSPVESPNLVPQSTVYWTAPGADQISPGKYRFTSTFKEGTKAKGTTGSVTNTGAVKTPLGPAVAVRIIQGG